MNDICSKTSGLNFFYDYGQWTEVYHATTQQSDDFTPSSAYILKVINAEIRIQ